MILARKTKSRTQTLHKHLWDVAESCETKGKDIGIGTIAKITGILHDFGKLNPDWQTYLSQGNTKGKVDHSTYGGLLLFERYYDQHIPTNASALYKQSRRFIIESMTHAIFSHHSGMLDMAQPDGTSGFYRRIYKEGIAYQPLINIFEQEILPLRRLDEWMDIATKEYMEVVNRVQQSYLYYMSQQNKPISTEQKKKEWKKACFSPLFTSHLLSILIDSDRQDAKNWMSGETPSLPTMQNDIFLNSTQQLLEDKITQFKTGAPANTVQQWRQKLSNEAFAFAAEPKGIYQLSLPVGAGKTFTSMRFAFQHIKKRVAAERPKSIIVVIPQTAIIEQNAAEIREVLSGENFVLEHHGQVVQEGNQTDDAYRLVNTKENWSAPIIFTTFYQYLDTFYGGRNSNLRRLHRLANSVIIFDEVQSLPATSISLFNESINYLYEVGNTTSLLCTATQPALQNLQNGIRFPVRSIVKDNQKIAAIFKRVTFHPIKPKMNTEKLADFTERELRNVQSVLVILNTKQVVKELYQEIAKRNLGVPTYHLSASMIPKHRKEVLERVRKHLDAGEKVICVSTNIIEAGVNVDFDTVIRSLAGLDKIAQASGRCNRHGKRKSGTVYLIDHMEEYLEKLPEIQKGKSLTQDMLLSMDKNKSFYDGYLISPLAIQEYFHRFYQELGKKKDFPVQIENYKSDIYTLLFENQPQHPLQIPPKPANRKAIPTIPYPFLQKSAYRLGMKAYQVYEGNQVHVVVLADTWSKKTLQDSLQKAKKDETIRSFNIERTLQPYLLSIYQEKVDKLIQKGIIEMVKWSQTEEIYVIYSNHYNNTIGFLH